MAADVSVTAFNPYPVQLDIPSLGFEILVPNCESDEPFISLAQATTKELHVVPKTDVVLEADGIVRDLPESLTTQCPNSNSSPLDLLLQEYMHGGSPTVFVKGSESSSSETPKWVQDLLASIVVPIEFPGRTFDNLVREFSLDDVKFALPNPMSPPDSPDGSPKVSGTIMVLAALPSEMNFGVNVTRVRAQADIFYKKQKLGVLDLHEWQKANSTKIESEDLARQPLLKIQSRVEEAPLNVTDGDVLSDVVQALLFGSKPVMLDVKAAVDVKVHTVLGKLVLKDVPAEGRVPVKRPSHF